MIALRAGWAGHFLARIGCSWCRPSLVACAVTSFDETAHRTVRLAPPHSPAGCVVVPLRGTHHPPQMARIRFSDAGEIMSGRLDKTLIYAMHNALRRELGNIARDTPCIHDAP